MECSTCEYYLNRELGDGGRQHVCIYPTQVLKLPLWVENLLADYERYLPNPWIKDVECNAYKEKVNG